MITGYGEMLEGGGIINIGWVSEKDMPFRSDGSWEPLP